MESTTIGAPYVTARGSTSATHIGLLVSEPCDGATNMAIDEALLRRAQRTGETVWRVYGWNAPSVSLGRNQTARGYYDLCLARSRGIEFVRRPTGGRAILHHREITYSVTGPTAAGASLRESYGAINRLLCEALRLLGVRATTATSSAPRRYPGLAPCFESPVEGELVVDNMKLAGSAQVRDGSAFLQHGSILLDDDQHVLPELTRTTASPQPATLRAILGRDVSRDEFVSALQWALSRDTGSPPNVITHTDSFAHDVQLLIDTRYANPDWTWRR
jgi:lipoate-protein ligase A